MLGLKLLRVRKHSIRWIATPARDGSTNSLQLTQVERHQLPMKSNSTQTEYPQTCIHKLVEAVVELLPDTKAVVFEQESLTYRQLNSRANILSHYLQALGVGKEVLVGICMERSLEMVVGLLGILKAGGAYVPLGPAYPTERLTFMLEDTQTKESGYHSRSNKLECIYL